jgi:Zn-dependent protease
MLAGSLSLSTFLALALTLVVAFTFHELAHAWVAVELGDETPRRLGRLTLNPLAHLDPIGSLMLLVAGFGWAKPVPVSPYNLKYGPRAGMALVAIAGPFSNFVMALLAAIPFRVGFFSLPTLWQLPASVDPVFTFLQQFLLVFIQVNIGLMLFNLLPIGPLDGVKVLRGIAPHEWDSWLNPLEQWGSFVLMALFLLGGSLLGRVLWAPAQFLMRAILGY